jgi:general secretion pathway protein I
MFPKPAKRAKTSPGGPKTTQGFTLIEVLVAMAVVAIVVIAIFKLNSQSIDMANATRFHTIAPLLAQSVMADIESRKIEDAASDSGDFGETYPGFSWQVSIDAVVSEPLGEAADNLRKIDLTVSYIDASATYTLALYRYFNE